MEIVTYRERIYKNYIQAQTMQQARDAAACLLLRAPYLRRLIKQHFPKDRQAHILDLGCGYGALLYFAREAGYTNIRGIDGSPQQVEAAQGLGIEGVAQGDLVSMLAGQPDSSQDCIITFDVIEHFTKAELLPLVDEVLRVLKSGGSWIIHTPNGESPFAGRMRYGDLTHELIFTQSSIAQLLLSSGYRRVQSFEDAPTPHGVKSAIRWLLWKIIRGALRFYLASETGSSGKESVFTMNFITVGWK
jgi:2-polyprenyl-3-methyl-5-hydroxy-6-metoxy-1,4-benzoquinol methylase